MLLSMLFVTRLARMVGFRNGHHQDSNEAAQLGAHAPTAAFSGGLNPGVDMSGKALVPLAAALYECAMTIGLRTILRGLITAITVALAVLAVPGHGASAADLDGSCCADPGGIRKALAGRGITFGASYTGDVNGNVSGGIKQGTHYAGLLELYNDIDLQKAMGLTGLSFHMSVYQIHGTSISGENIGGLASVTNIEAFPSTRLFELWLEQTFLNDKLSVRMGQIAVDDEFFASEAGGNFFNSTFGWTTISSDNLPVGGPIYPIPTPGVRVAFEPSDNFKLMAGLWNGNPVGPCPEDKDPGQCNTNGLDFRLQDPPLLVVEAAFAYNKDAGLPGTIKAGGWRHFGDFDDQRRDINGGPAGITGGDPLKHEGNHGLYAVVDQMLFKISPDGARNVSMSARIAGSPSDRNQIDFYTDVAVVAKGLFASRPSDVMGVALAYSGISNDAAGYDRDSGLSVVRDHETVLEVSYTAEVLPGLTLQPDFQYYWSPGGGVPLNASDPNSRAIEDAAIFGMRTVVNY